MAESGRPSDPAHRSLAAALRAAREALITRWLERVRSELDTTPISTVELMDHMPAFLDELVASAEEPAHPIPSEPAGQHGVQRLRLGFDAGEVVREYGLLHECISEGTAQVGYTPTAADQRLIARSINRGIAWAVSQYVSQRDAELERQASEHLGFIAHEVRNGLSTALMAYEVLCHAGEASSNTLERLGRSLHSVAEIVDSALTQSWLRMGVAPKAQPLPVRAFLEQLTTDLGAGTRDRTIVLDLQVPEDMVIAADPRLLRSAVGNLVTNGLKFSPPGATITVRAQAIEGRLILDVADGCGGLPPGKAEELFSPLVQRHENRTGFGLGLAIVQQAAQSHGGTVKVRDQPGVGCVFTLDLPLVHEPAR